MVNLNKAVAILEKYKKPVWQEIKKYLQDDSYPTAFKIPAKYQKDIEFYWKIVKDYPERQGKYLRPTLLLLAAKAMGADIKKAIKTASAMQLSEEWLLIHDDIQDHSFARRGKPALQRLYGNELALNAGDTLHIIMWKIILDNEAVLGIEKTLAIANEFYQVLKRTADGQAIEIMWAKDEKIRTNDKDWFFIADGKTAYYTIAAPLRLGGIIAGASKKQLDLLAKFGLQLGRCFQLVDDTLDLTSNYKGPDQKIGNDIYEGKKTLILSHLIRTANKGDKKKIIAILKKTPEEKTDKEVKWILQKMADYKSIDYAKKIALKLKETAYQIFENDLGFLKEKSARQELKTLIKFVLERKH
jgi:geranylgeranyl diphosphate synthase type II